MKICIIGNSHIAAIKQGWTQVEAEMPGFEVTFFGARGRRMSGLKLRGDRLVAQLPELAKQVAFVSGGQTEIVPKAYDAIILSGLGLFVPRLPAGTSAALRQQACADYMESSIVPGLVTKLRQVTDQTIWLSPSPLVASLEGEPKPAMVAYGLLLDSLQAALGDPNCVMLGQPAETLGADLTTHSLYSEGSVRLTTPDTPAEKVMHRDLELKHMNGQFGALWLKQNLTRLDKAA